MMKSKIIALMLFALLATGLQAQTTLKELYREFSGAEHVTKVNLNGLALMFAKPFMEKEGMGKVTSIRVLSLEECAPEVKERFSRAALGFRDEGYELFLNANDQDEKARIFVKIEDQLIREMVIMTMGDDPALVHLKGKFRPADIDQTSNGGK
ncbi:MAG: hypothetical protein PWQ38_1259 [Proteiniphilum sp.]|jgi:hypothetical protein|nr:hypothetical protein [Proteiniphilum sp.]